MDLTKHRDAKLLDYQGPYFPPETYTLDQARIEFPAIDKESWIEAAQATSKYAASLVPHTQDGRRWFLVLVFAHEGQQIAFLIDKIDPKNPSESFATAVYFSACSHPPLGEADALLAELAKKIRQKGAAA